MIPAICERIANVFAFRSTSLFPSDYNMRRWSNTRLIGIGWRMVRWRKRWIFRPQGPWRIGERRMTGSGLFRECAIVLMMHISYLSRRSNRQGNKSQA